MAELAEVISRGKFAHRVHAAGLSAAELVQDYRCLAQLVEPRDVPRIVLNDPDDDHVLACALTANADLIVTGDRKHLLPLGAYQGIRIVTPAQALQIIGSG